MTQTAVKWLIQQVVDNMGDIPLDIQEQAKQMEKEQIMKTVKDSWYMAKGSNFQYPQEEQYYNETYNK